MTCWCIFAYMDPYEICIYLFFFFLFDWSGPGIGFSLYLEVYIFPVRWFKMCLICINLLEPEHDTALLHQIGHILLLRLPLPLKQILCFYFPTKPCSFTSFSLCTVTHKVKIAAITVKMSATVMHSSGSGCTFFLLQRV